MKRWFFLSILALLLLGCGAKEETPATSLPESVPVSEATELATPVLEQEVNVLIKELQAPVILQCHAPGILEERCDSAVVDYSNTADGYVMAQYFGDTDKKLKLRVEGPAAVYTYNLTPGEWGVFPLSDGDGSYRVAIYRNTAGNRYSLVMVADVEVVLGDEFAPFLRPNQYVNYTDAPNTMELASQLCGGLSHPLDKVAAVYDYVVENFTYDKEKAATVKSGYLPVLETVLEEKKGICFDYAAVMTAMLRSQEVPCKLVVGYAGTVYHAWISVWTEENGWVDGVIFFDGHQWKRMDPTFASSGEGDEEIMNFIENGDYLARYVY